MHPVIVDNLEEFMAGGLAPAELRDFETHLADCPACRHEVQSMQEISEMLGTLRPVEAVVPSPSFTARVMAQVGESATPSFWRMFALDFALGRRVVFASLLTLAVLGSYLVSRESHYASGPTDPEAVMATGQGSQSYPGNDRDRMLVTLASYEP